MSEQGTTNTPSDQSKKWFLKRKNIRFIFEAAAIVVGILLLCETHKQVKVSRDQVNVSRMTSEKEIRAYVAVSQVMDSVFDREKWFNENAKKRRDGNARFSMSYYIKNIGQTPAYDLQVRFKCVNGKDSLRDIDTSAIRLFQSSNKTVLMPGLEIHFPIYIERESHNVERPRTFLYGEITFIDVYDKPRFVRVCLEYIHEHERFFPYHKYNNADKDTTAQTQT